MMIKVPMTAEGAAELQKELEALKRKRPEVMKAIGEARAHGDLRENAEYHAAKEQQGLMEARIRDIEYKLANSDIIDITKIPNQGRVLFGTKVSLVDLGKNSRVIYRLVGEDEANVSLGKISITSPLARALIGKNIGDIVEVKTPLGIVDYEIVSVEHVW